MTRSEFLARFTIQHASVTRAIDFANKLEQSEEFEGWDEGELSEEVSALIVAAEAIVQAGVEDVTQSHILALENAIALFTDDEPEDESPDSDA